MATQRQRLHIGSIAVILAAAPAYGGEFTVEPRRVVDSKPVFGRIETRDVVPARPRIGGTLARLTVTEGDAVTEGQTIGMVIDDKLALQLRAAEARMRALASDRSNVQTEYERARTLLERGASTQQRVDQLRTQLDVLRNQIAAADADKAVIVQQTAEGEVTAPVSGRIVKRPVTPGAVVMPGEQIALIAGGGFFLRLALPERHATQLKIGASVPLVTEQGATNTGRIAKIYPQIENGRVIADVEIEKPGDFFVGARVLAEAPVGERTILAVPLSAVTVRSGIDFLTLKTDAGQRNIAVVVGSKVDLTGVPGVEILSGVQTGDRLVIP